MKAGYRKRLVERLLQNLRVGRELKIDLLEAISMLSISWAEVNKETIQNCFRHAGFRMPGDDTPNSDSTEDTAGVSAKVWNELAGFPGAIDGSTFDEFVSADDDVPIMGQLQDEDYIADVVPTTSQTDSNMEIDDGPLPTSSEVISARALVRRYCLNVNASAAPTRWTTWRQRTEKINMSSIKQVISEAIEGHEEYHIMALQLGTTEASRYWIYWVPAQYVDAIKETILGK
ncbi:hypothetical protein HPB51_004268 [Rhipicephalus microplus]|uniref:UBFD1 PH-like C-terminal domain-containing protein n=1 Tax=Rhipicephalus microplus TaxID=6941 RepID=A0A9J6EQT6_RHIMP|nr:hypothetical protein HPB51_004268 [Rhipicephalus microplus]